jgi:hypothetical protein
VNPFDLCQNNRCTFAVYEKHAPCAPASFDHLVRQRQRVWWKIEAKCLRGLEIDD